MPLQGAATYGAAQRCGGSTAGRRVVEVLHEAPVAWCQWQARNVVRVYPGDPSVFQALWFALDFRLVELDHEWGTRVLDRKEKTAHRPNMDPEFLGELTSRGFERPLPGLDLASWEFPEAAMPLVGRALAKKHSPFPLDDGRDDRD
jgi:hypothetical protein